MKSYAAQLRSMDREQAISFCRRHLASRRAVMARRHTSENLTHDRADLKFWAKCYCLLNEEGNA